MKLHPLITEDRVVQACERRRSSLDNPGFCNECGAGVDGVEPDLRGGRCEVCGTFGAVHGCEALLVEFI